jgi:small-conductance mechanosensitive channel
MKGINIQQLIYDVESRQVTISVNIEKAREGKIYVATAMLTYKDTTLVVRLFEVSNNEVVIKVLGVYPMFPAMIALVGSQENEEKIESEILGVIKECLGCQYQTATISKAKN